MTDRYREGFDAALDAVLAEDAALYYTDLPLLTAHEAVRRVRSRRIEATTNAASGEAEPNSETDRPGVSP